MAYVITKPGGGYYSMYGWRGSPASAYQFRSKDEALDHIRTQRLIGALAEQYKPPSPAGVEQIAPFGTERPQQ